MKKIEESQKEQLSPTSVTTQFLKEDYEVKRRNDLGLSRNLCRVNTSKQASQASPEVESFLNKVEQTLLKKAQNGREPIRFGID